MVRGARLVLAAAVIPIVAAYIAVACTRTELVARRSDLLSKVGMTGVGPVFIADLVTHYAVNVSIAALIYIPHRSHKVYL